MLDDIEEDVARSEVLWLAAHYLEMNSEVESFFYLTGLFIRLAVNNAAAPSS